MPHKSQGSALLSALFIMTLVAIAATAMSTRLQLDIYRARLVIQSDKLQLASQTVSFWSMDVLAKTDAKLGLLNRENTEGMVLAYPESMKGIYPDINIQGALYDLQARFNLNNLQNTNLIPMFLLLLKDNLKNVELKDLREMVKATAKWINTYDPAWGVDNLTQYYARQSPGYLPAFQYMQSPTEFRLVAGVTAKIYEEIQPYITALPTSTSINLNTASPKILKILGNGLTDSQLQEILQLRDSKGQFESKDMLLLSSQFGIPAYQMGVESEYFLSVATVSSADLTLKHYVVLQRKKNNSGQYEVFVVSETLNTY
jgi:general secretion pathway protein K